MANNETLVLNKGVNRVSGEHISDEDRGRDFIVIAIPIHETPESKQGVSKRGKPYHIQEACPSIFGFTEVINGKAFDVRASVSRFVNDL